MFILKISNRNGGEIMQKYKDKSLNIEERIDDLLSKMTNEEKVGQMLQVSYNTLSKEDYEKYKNLGIGSFLHVLGDEADDIKKRAEKTRLGIPPIFGIDAIHGHCLLNGATVFPSQLAMSSSFNRKLIHDMGKATAKEVAADGLDWTFSPVLCIARDLRWGRVNETFGEDSYVIGELGKAIIEGYEEDNLIIACAKHYIAYGEATGGRDAYDSEVSERKIREVFLPPFEKAAKIGCGSVMTAYGSVDSVPLNANPRMVREILKDEIGFNGFVVSDYENVLNLVTRQFIAENLKDASKLSIEAGNDMSMNTHEFYDCVSELIENNEIDIKYIDDAVRRILRAKFRIGLFDGKKTVDRSVINCDEHKELNHKLAQESAVLLKNDGILPLKENKTIAVIGPNADDIRAIYGDCLAQNGEYRDRADLELSGYQTELVKRLIDTKKPVIAVLVNCKPLCISYLKENCNAIVEDFNGGDFAGLAIAEMIGGKFNPSGKLTISFPRHSSQTPCYYNQYEGWHGGQYVDLEKGYVYEFGDGLSYSEFEYSNLRLSKNTIKNEEEITVSVDVTNKGNMDGKETVLMFVNDVISSVLTPTKQLKGFEKVFIKSGETATVNLKLNIKDLAIVTRDSEYIVEKGKFEIMVGRNTKEYLKDILSVEENIKF